MSTDSLINQIFSGGTALAGLILVFLGGVLAAFESHDHPRSKLEQAHGELTA